MAISTGIGAVCSLIVGGVVDFLIKSPEGQPYMVYPATILASIMIMPISYSIGIKMFDFLRSRWSESEDELLQLKFFEDELRKEIKLIEEIKLPIKLEEKKKRELLEEYKKYRATLFEKKFFAAKNIRKQLNDE